MSTLKTTNLQHPSAASPNLVLAADGSVSGGAGLGGLVHINTTAFTTQSSVSINNCFTTTYDNYVILLNSTVTTSAVIQYRMRASGTDNTAAQYQWQRILGSNTTAVASRSASGTAGAFSQGSSAFIAAVTMFSPALAAVTPFLSNYSFDPNSVGPEAGMYGGAHNVASAFDGFSLIPAAGTITGTVRIYGYKNS